ncbi:MAG: hypothetical protein FWE82_02095 [Defluviitaleaceae bacterium]|nr:hypothetical protein [Defluviitaleaceae bacterium]
MQTSNENHRQRFIDMLSFRPVGRPVTWYFYQPVGLLEHGEKLNDLYEKYPGDFDTFTRQPIPVLPPEVFDAEGRYYERKTDEWGAEWEYRIWGVMGHALNVPVKKLADAANYKLPQLPAYLTDIEGQKKYFAERKKNFYTFGGAGGLFERMWAIRGFSDFMMDIEDDAPETLALLDRLTDYFRAHVESAAEAGADGISFGDDYGTQDALLVSKETFRRVVKPRLKRMLEPAAAKGMHIHFHTCGRVINLFDDLKDLGIGSIWPQLPAYDLRELKDAIDFYRFSIALHTDRAITMTHGTPNEVRELVLLENEIFKPKDGGAWFHIEVDNGFPFDNIKAMIETIYSL